MLSLDKIVILDFGSQYTQLIRRRIRELSVPAEILPHSTRLEELQQLCPKGVILSGGPGAADDVQHVFDKRILDSELPILGICLGMQLMNTLSGGSMHTSDKEEYGRAAVTPCDVSPIFSDKTPFSAWMSHGHSINQIAENFHVTSRSEDGVIAAIQHKERPHFGLQFHPEVTHTEGGHHLLDNFLKLCAAPRTWNPEDQIEEIIDDIRKRVGDRQVLSLISGGVDSTVSTILCVKALGAEKVHGLHVDSGLMREGESAEVVDQLTQAGLKNLHVINASGTFFGAIKGVTDPEKKRKLIGQTFIDVMQQRVEEMGLTDDTTLVCQGTLYTDLIESGQGCGKHAAVIKSHHNVDIPFLKEKRARGLIVEPNAELFKDEVRLLGQRLGIDQDLLGRHPFPGPGLGIRILGEVTKEKVSTLQKADAIFTEEIHKAGLYDEIWQALAVLLPVEAVGVMGDERTVGNAVALRAVTSTDGMTADVYPFPIDLLTQISTRIVNEVPGVNRVVYDTTSKPPSTIEWE